MPVSRGGGFSGGGGSRGGSFSSSGGSRSSESSQTFSRHRHFPGARHYIFIDRYGRRSEFYYKGRPKRQNVKGIIIGMSCVILALLALFLVLSTFVYPRKLGDAYCNETGIYLQDDANIIADTSSFNSTMHSFYEKTGIEPYLYAINESQFPAKVYGALDKNSLEDYAYDRYLQIFDDEGHYMVMFVVFEDGENMWLEMAGTDTTDLLDDAVFSSFQKNLTNRLDNIDSSYTYEMAFSESFDIMAEEAFVITMEDKIGRISMILIGVVVSLILVGVTVSQVKQAQLINDYLDYEEKHKNDPKTFDEYREEKEEEKAAKKEAERARAEAERAEKAPKDEEYYKKEAEKSKKSDDPWADAWKDVK